MQLQRQGQQPTTSLALTWPSALAMLLMLWHSPSEATVYKCEMGGKTAYQATPCAGGQALALSAPRPSTPSGPSAIAGPAGKPACPSDELSLNFQSTPLPMVLQVVADFSGRRAQIDPAVTGNPAIQYRCTHWRTALQDIAQRHQLDIRVEEKLIFVRKR